MNTLNTSTSTRLRKSGHKKHLSTREIQVMAQLARGETRKSAADKLGISIHTVESHTRRIFYKLGVHSMTSAVVIILT
jgi:DNA-binding NarL/FixJ family response regulator